MTALSSPSNRAASLVAVGLVAGLLAAPGSALAQQDQQLELLAPKARQGYYIGIGPRIISWVVEDEDFGSLGGLVGFGASFRFGQKVNEWLGLGLVLGGGGAANVDWSAGGGGLQLEAQVQPWLETDLAFRFGIGVAGIGFTRADEARTTDDDPEGTFGAMYTVAASYELFPWHEEEKFESGGFAFSFFVEGQLSPGLAGITTYGAVLGIELTWWSGLNRNKLDLPPDAAFVKD
ncbi:MAG: hypothetical protein AAFN74_00560 [Myxococcota bacterium]